MAINGKYSAMFKVLASVTLPNDRRLSFGRFALVGRSTLDKNNVADAPISTNAVKNHDL